MAYLSEVQLQFPKIPATDGGQIACIYKAFTAVAEDFGIKALIFGVEPKNL